ncbi:MAG: squalene/phytoene synthase family protein [Candidatus Kapaibacterium sp.]|jgi:squalene synthase HpnC
MRTMKFTPNEIRDLCSSSGGKFAVNETQTAFQWCKRLSLGHYENFPVGSVLIPKSQRPHFFSVYAFSRIADDIADEPGFDQAERAALLQQYESLLLHHSAKSTHPIFRSLHETIDKCSIPLLPLVQLLEAFRRDVFFVRPVTLNDIDDYCSYSANPIGELVLRITGAYSQQNHQKSNAICTALQMVNFWQDTSTDLRRGRNYYPITLCTDISFDDKNLGNEEFCTNFPSVLNAVIDATWQKFEEGQSLIASIPMLRLRSEIAFTIIGGKYILSRVQELGVDIVHQRPALSVLSFPSIGIRTLLLLLR